MNGRRVLIRSDGTLGGTVVADAETGEILPCRYARVELLPAERPKIQLELAGKHDIDIIGESDLMDRPPDDETIQVGGATSITVAYLRKLGYEIWRRP